MKAALFKSGEWKTAIIKFVLSRLIKLCDSIVRNQIYQQSLILEFLVRFY